MFDPSESFSLPEAPGIILFPDIKDPLRFYAIPETPRIALDEQGQPQISFMVYQKKLNSHLVTTGGQITLTLSLALTTREQIAVRTALLLKQIAPRPPGEPAPSLPEIHVMTPEWLEGEAQAHLTPTLKTTGQPSLVGGNECTISLNLTPEQAQELMKAWHEGLPDARLTYRVTVSAAKRELLETVETRMKSAETPGTASRTWSDISIHTDLTQAVRHPLTFEGKMPLTDTQLQSHLLILTL